MENKKYRLKKDIIIPAGTILKNIDGLKSEYVSGNYEYIFGLTKDTHGRLIYSVDDGIDLDEWMEEVK